MCRVGKTGRNHMLLLCIGQASTLSIEATTCGRVSGLLWPKGLQKGGCDLIFLVLKVFILGTGLEHGRCWETCVLHVCLLWFSC